MRRSSSGLRDGVARAIVMHRSDSAVRLCFRLVSSASGVPEKLYLDEGLSWTSSDRYGRVLSFTVIVFNYTVTALPSSSSAVLESLPR